MLSVFYGFRVILRIFFPLNNNQLVSEMKTRCVFIEVGTEYLLIISVNFSFSIKLRDKGGNKWTRFSVLSMNTTDLQFPVCVHLIAYRHSSSCNTRLLWQQGLHSTSEVPAAGVHGDTLPVTMSSKSV